MQNLKFRILTLLVLLFVAVPTFAQRRSIVEQAQADAGSFGLFAELVEIAGLTDVLNGDGPYTALMPTNDAINFTLESVGVTKDDLVADPTLVKTILQYHILDGKFLAADITTAYGADSDGVLELITLGGEILTLQVQTDGTIVLGGQGISVFLPDITVENGVIHAISGVLLPPSLVDEEGRATFRDLETIADLLSGAPEFSTLVSAVTENGLLDTLAGDAPYTVFAPTNDAFVLALGDIPADTLSVLQMHIVPGRMTVEELGNQLAVNGRDVGILETLGGTTITYQLSEDGTVILNGQGILTFTTDVLVDNGVIHYIGSVMLPQREETVAEFISTSTDFTILESALEATNMTSSMEGDGPFTVFAPTDDAFTDLADRLNITMDELLSDTDALTTILQFHVLNGNFSTSDIVTAFGAQDDNVLELSTLGGEELTLQATDESTLILNGQGIDVFLPDVVVTNGLIQGTSGVMIPPSLIDENGLPTFGNFNSVMDVLNRDSSSFSSLVKLLEDNNLASTLSGIGQFTIFAPTNGALLAAQSDIASLDAAEVAGFHVVEGRYSAQDLADLFVLEADNILELTTLSGEELWLQVDDTGTIFLNAQGITATITDLSASNGIVHAISGVLLP